MKAIYYYIFYKMHKLFDREIYHCIGASILAKLLLIIFEVWLVMLIFHYCKAVLSLFLNNRNLDLILLSLIFHN